MEKLHNIKDNDLSSGGEARSSGGEAQSSGGAVLNREDMIRIIHQRRPIPEHEIRRAIEWKPWYNRSDELPKTRPERSSNDYHDHMKHQVDILEKAKETLLETEGDEFYNEHAEYIEEVYAKLDEDSRVDFKRL